MLENEPVGDVQGDAEGIDETNNEASTEDRPRRAESDALTGESPRRRAASRPAGPPPEEPAGATPDTSRTRQQAVSDDGAPAVTTAEEETTPSGEPSRTRSASRRREKAAPKRPAPDEAGEPRDANGIGEAGQAGRDAVPAASFQPPMVVFQPPQLPPSKPASKRDTATAPPVRAARAEKPEKTDADGSDEPAADEEQDDKPARRRRRRGGRGRGKSKDAQAQDESAGEDDVEEREPAPAEEDEDESAPDPAESVDAEGDGSQGEPSTRRRRRRRRRGDAADPDPVGVDDPAQTVVHVREPRLASDEVQSVKGSTRLEAKKQRRREGREQGRRRPPIITESEFLARRESVERVMVIRQLGERTQIAVLEDGVLVEHYVDRSSHQSYVGNVYLGKVQNVLPSMEAAFVDIGKGRNAVLYAGEVNWDVAGMEGQPRRIESALKSGQSVLVQVTKDPLGHKGARLTSQISLPGRYLVYVPDGTMTGISRKLPDKERSRLKQILKKVMPENAGVIVRTAAEGAAEEELSRDVSRLAAQWENIQRKAKSAAAPALLYGEPDLTIRVVRDIFNEDFSKLVVAGDDAGDMVEEYVQYVAPHLADRLVRRSDGQDAFGAYRIDEQIAKALERKVWLPSGGSLVIDRTEAMTVIDVNTGKFTGQGGNLEETVTRNNLEAAEEIVRQLRLRDVGGIIVIDFIDMVLENNRELVQRRLLECLARDRTKHQVAEVTSLGLVQMTRKRVGQGLVEAFSEVCEHCNGRGLNVSLTPVEPKPEKAGSRRRKRKGDIERAVEDKLARAERARSAAAPDGASEPAEPAETVEAAETAEDAAVAGQEATEVIPATLEAVEARVDAAPATGISAAVETGSVNGARSAESEPSGGNGRRRRSRRTRTKTEDRTEDRTEDKTEDSTAGRAEAKTEDSTESSTEDRTEDKTEDTAERKTEDRAEATAD